MSKIKTLLTVSWLKTIYFNFKYLPLKQGIKLPVFLYKVRLLKCKGKVKIESKNIKPGLIKLGVNTVSLYPKGGNVWENHGGNVIFKGKCEIGNNSSISIGKTGNIDFGDNFKCTAALKLTSYCSVTFKENVRLAWEVIIMDTSFHKLKDKDGKLKGRPYAPVVIGRNNWLPTRAMVLKGTKTPDYTIFGAGSILNKDYSSNPTHTVMAGSPLKVRVENVWRDVDDDKVAYQD
jgi:acetyltransferase-like isoleucine patch superfamily enzyme